MNKSIDMKTWEEKVEKEGLAWEMEGELERALNSYDALLREAEEVTLTSQLEDREKKAIVAYLLMRKAGVLLRTGKVEEGEMLINQALTYAERSGNLLILGRVKLGLGVFYGSKGRFEEGEKLLKEALLSFNEGADYDSRQGAGWALLNLGGLYLKQRRLDLAEKKLAEAIELLETIQNWVGVASAYELKAKLNSIKGNHALAKGDLMNAISFYEKQGMKEKADTLRNSMKKS